MKFNIITEDGGVFLNCIVLVLTGPAKSKRDIHINMKYQGGICICNKHYFNKWISTNEIYEIEPIERKLLSNQEENEEKNEEK